GRRCGANAGNTTPNELGVRIAAPAPCRRRAPMRTDADGAIAQTADARTNNDMPTRNPRLRPYRSARRPAGTSRAANTIAYPLSTHDSSARLEPGKSRWRSGNVMLTMNKSSRDANTPIETITKVRHGLAIIASTGTRFLDETHAIRGGLLEATHWT